MTLKWEHEDITLAELLIPIYKEFSYCMSPEEFIKTYWNTASEGLRGEMIEYINRRPFSGCEKYIDEYHGYLSRKCGGVLSLY